MKRTSLLIIFGLLLVGGAGAAYFTSSEPTDSTSEDISNVVEVARVSLQTHVSETGTLEPIHTIDIKSQFSGEVRTLFVSEGQEVSQGQPLALIQQEPGQARQVAQLRASLEREGLNVAQARRNLARMDSLHRQGYVARNELENAEQDAEQAMVRRELAERELLLALGGNQALYDRYISQQSSVKQLEEFEIVSPSSGTIIDIQVQPGEIITSGTATVGGGTVLMQLADLGKMVAKAKVNEVNIVRVRVGQAVTVKLDALLGKVFEGQVTAIAPQGVKDKSIVTYEVIIEIDNSGLNLRPMMTANVDIATETMEEVLTIPLEMLQSEQGDDIVYLNQDGKKVRRKVRIALRTNTEAVVSDGLQVGDRVIVPTFTPSVSRR
ncbi:MAG: efflux RND transporter periplasmic adaptor subunit [Nitrospirae bacterium]|nr:efflux RND transporter periplasmic adaptor subunit [Nitrospirota bacterium]